MQSIKFWKYTTSTLFILLSLIASSQTNKFIGKYTSIGYLEASTIQMFDTDSSYIDTTITNYKSSAVFLDILENKLIIFDMFYSETKNKKIDEVFNYKILNDTLFLLDEEKESGYLVFNESTLEMKPNFTDSSQSSTFFFTNDVVDIQTNLNQKSLKKIVISTNWNLNLNSVSQLTLSFSKNNEILFTTPSETIISPYSWVEFANDYFILFKNNNHVNYMKIVKISKDKLSIEMPVNKKLERFDFIKN